MDVTKAQTLANLLEKAISSVQVIDQRQNMAWMVVDTRQYRSLLQSCRQSYKPDLRSYTHYLRPTIQDAALKERLRGVIKDNLVQYVHNGKIQSSVFGTVGGSSGGFYIEKLLSHWLIIAIWRGAKYAAAGFVGSLC